MWFMFILSWLAIVIQVCFITLSIAAGLYYLAELVEEYTVTAGKIIKYMIWFTVAVYICLLLFESLPLSMIVTGLLSNVSYLLVHGTFPFIELTSPVFLLSVVFIVINHYLAFSYFASVWHPFSEVLGFFTVCLWLVPFAFFVSLSANENVLPTSVDKPQSKLGDGEGDVVTNYFRRKARRYNLMSFLKGAQETILPQRMKKGY